MMGQAYFATVARGLEPLAVDELTELGATDVSPVFAGVHFQGNQALLYRVNLWSRLIFRVLVPIAEVKAFNADILYKSIKKLDWSAYVRPEQTLAVRCTGSNSQLNHSHFTALQIKNAIVDQQRERYGQRSSIDLEQPQIVVNAHIDHNRCHLSLDSSGVSLHRRGYRPAIGLAPLKETLAAAILRLMEWHPEQPLYDPLCGSATLLLEAGLQSLRRAPGRFHSQFCFQHWSDFDATVWQALCQQAQAGERDRLPALIWGSDQDSAVIEQAQANGERCGLGPHLRLWQQEISQVEAPAAQGVVFCNPPYGKRIGNAEALGDFYQSLGDILKQRFKGWTAFILSGNTALSKRMGLRTARRFPLLNGAIACTLLKYELY